MTDTPETDIDARFEAAAAAHRAGRLGEAEQRYGALLAMAPGSARAHHNLGVLRLQQGRAEDAAGLLARAAELDPARADTWIIYVRALAIAGDYEVAENLVDRRQREGQLHPHPNRLRVEFYRVWAAKLSAVQRYDEAVERLEAALAIDPSNGEAMTDLAVVLTVAGRLAESEPHYRRALEIDPRNLTALSNLAGTLRLMKRGAEAEAMYRRVLEFEPDDPTALYNLGVILRDRADIAEAKACFRRAMQRRPSLDNLVRAHLSLALIPGSMAEIAEQRAGYAQGLEEMSSDPRAFTYGGEKLPCSWFPLPYHGQDDRALVERTSQVLRAKVANLDYVAPRLAAPHPRGAGPIRLAIVSEFLRGHTVGRLYQGLVERLDRSRFEVTLVHNSYTGADDLRARLDGAAGRSITLGRTLEDQRGQMEALAPDIVFFPDIGMSMPTYCLAHSRLAPVQVTSWGHPNTTGVGTIDYFISAACIEPPAAQAFYGERLIQLGRLPAYCEPPALPERATSRADFNLPAEGVLYGCPQSLFKFHPQFDAVLAAIAEGDPRGHIILLDGRSPQEAEALRRRWRAAHPALLDRVRFLPRLSPEAFIAHLAHIDVLLDPIHFGSGITLYEAMAHGVPVVTWPGRFARGRIVAGAYRQMGVADAPVAERIEDYAPLALALGRDPARRARLRAELKAAAAAELFRDRRAVADFEAFLEAASEAGGRGQRLPLDWRPKVAA